MKTNGQKTFRKFQTTTALVAALGMALVGPAQAGRVTGNLGGSGVALPGSAPTGSASHGDLELNEQLLLSDQFDGSWIDESLAMSIAGKKRYLSHQACPQLPDGTNCLSISVGDEDDYSTWTILDNSCTKKRAGKSKQFKSSCWKGYQALHLAQVQIAPVETVDVSATQLDVFSESVSKVFVPNGAQMRFTHTVETMWQKHLSLSTEGTYRLNYEQVTESLYDASGAPVVDEDNPLCTGGDYNDECTNMEIYIRPIAAQAGSSAGTSTTMDGACNDNYNSQMDQMNVALQEAFEKYDDHIRYGTVAAATFTFSGLATLSGGGIAVSGAFGITVIAESMQFAVGLAVTDRFKRKMERQARKFAREYESGRLDCIDRAIGRCAMASKCVCEDSFEDEKAAKDCEDEKKNLNVKGVGGAGQTEGDGSHGAFNPGGSCSADWECAGYVNAICVDGMCVVDGGAPL